MSDASAHIAAWEAAGLIDSATADRLRTADPSLSEPDDNRTIRERSGASGRSPSSALFGPAVTIAEVFGYLGGAFLMGAWFATIANSASSADNPDVVYGIGATVAALAYVAIGMNLRSGDERRRRGAGVVFVLAVSAAGGAAGAFATAADLAWPLVGVIGSAAALATAVALRFRHPAVLTQFGVLAAFTTLSAALLAWVQDVLFPGPDFTDVGEVVAGGPDPIVLVVGSAAWWLLSAFLIGLIGLREARSAEPGPNSTASRRAGISRLWAGLVAIIGLASAVMRSGGYLAGDDYGRVLEPWIGDLGLLIVSIVLIERAFRREAAAYIYPAALGLVVALSDFNFSYLSENTETGLLIEGIILLGAGFAADRLRRRVGGSGAMDGAAQSAALVKPVDLT